MQKLVILIKVRNKYNEILFSNIFCVVQLEEFCCCCCFSVKYRESLPNYMADSIKINTNASFSATSSKSRALVRQVAHVQLRQLQMVYMQFLVRFPVLMAKNKMS